MRKLISHESPISLLSESREYNDYDYALVHLFEQNSSYYDFFKESVEMGRRVLLDNSIFELGESFEMNSFAEWIERLSPTEYIVPDVLENRELTVANLKKWNSEFSHIDGIKIGVVQGESLEEVRRCYREIELQCDKIAISFNYSLYSKLFPHPDELVSWMVGRKLLIDDLMQQGIINLFKPHHLLGCSLPSEFTFYQDEKYNFIQSIDTSNPVVHGIFEIPYSENGLSFKMSIKLADLLLIEVNQSQRAVIKRNINIFKELVYGE